MKFKVGNRYLELVTPNMAKILINRQIKDKFKYIYDELNRMRKEIDQLKEEIKTLHGKRLF